MLIGALKQTTPGEKRIPLLPDSIKKLIEKGADVAVEKSIGEFLTTSDQDYMDSGARVLNRDDLLSTADILVSVQKPSTDDITKMHGGAITISFLDPFNEKTLIQSLANADITSLSLEMLPRSSVNQKMDALSSQANLAGYYAVILAAQRSSKIFPMMTTPAGTIQPARIFVVGAGVAGLQAIATAKRLGARVEAFDTRPAVEEQVRSLGAKFVKIDLGQTGETHDGYAKTLTEQQLAKQREGMKKACAQSNIVITTAQVFGKKAPVIITADMINAMKPGSIILDMAIESGGNVEGSKLNEDVSINGVTILGPGNLPSQVCYDASLMFSSNMTQLILSHWNEEKKRFCLNHDKEFFDACLITRDGKIVNPRLKEM